MSYDVSTLEPALVWKYFDIIRQIPRSSGNEIALASKIVSLSRDKGFDANVDKKGNVVVRVPASPGCEEAPVLILQGHLDMVCEKSSDREMDFEKDPIVLVREGDWIMGDGTTLGADNGIGLAVALSFLEKPTEAAGPLELLFTVEEETGLDGAAALEPDFVTGRMLLNTDSEEDGVFYIGCAGGRDSSLALPINRSPTPSGEKAFTVEVKGLRGGHSGSDIIHNRGNALKLLARAVNALSTKMDISLADFNGGDKHNAIPREARATILLAPNREREMADILGSQLDGFKEEFASGDPDMQLIATECDRPESVVDAGSRDRFLRLLLGLPHGVLAMVRGMRGMVETSNNLARVRTGDTLATVVNSTRSSVASAIDGIISQIEAVGLAAGATMNLGGGYPGWKPRRNSALLKRAGQVWTMVHGEEAKFEVIHAGLECGIIGERYPGMDMISIGPTILGAHSPEEKVSIRSVQRFFEFVRAFVESIARA